MIRLAWLFVLIVLASSGCTRIGFDDQDGAMTVDGAAPRDTGGKDRPTGADASRDGPSLAEAAPVVDRGAKDTPPPPDSTVVLDLPMKPDIASCLKTGCPGSGVCCDKGTGVHACHVSPYKCKCSPAGAPCAGAYPICCAIVPGDDRCETSATCPK